MSVLVDKDVLEHCSPFTGYTGLHIAGAWGQLETLKALVAGGANPSLVNVRRETACNIAERYGKKDCVDYLQSAGMQVRYFLISIPEQYYFCEVNCLCCIPG